ncbi:MAG: peptide-methionine (S)-S-oxide reductase MsrA [Candidatus Paceibacterota bacterium]
MNTNEEKAYFAAGCFWGVEESFLKTEGVLETRVGFSGGDTPSPTYEQVSSGDTGHAETVEVIFDIAVLTYEKLVRIFFGLHNPTTRNKQGADTGTQYRSAIFYVDDAQKKVAESIKGELQREGIYENMVTEIELFTFFYPAEEYHQKYVQKKRNI